MTNPWTLCDPAERALGLDIAHWQGTDIPWEPTAKLGIEWVIAKTFHATGRVKSAEIQLEGASKLSLICGRYAWWLPRVDTKMQAAAWAQIESRFHLPVMIDVEEPDVDVRGAPLLRRLEELIQRLADAIGRLPIIYTGAWYWREWLGNLDSEIVASCELAHAAYPRKAAMGLAYHDAVDEVCAQTPPVLAAPWALRKIQPLIWQFDGDKGLFLPSGTGVVSGVDVDVNTAARTRLRGLIAALRDTDPHPGPIPEPGLHLGDPTAGGTLWDSTNSFELPLDKGPKEQ